MTAYFNYVLLHSGLWGAEICRLGDITEVNFHRISRSSLNDWVQGHVMIGRKGDVDI
jgi:hypothetical protein